MAIGGDEENVDFIHALLDGDNRIIAFVIVVGAVDGASVHRNRGSCDNVDPGLRAGEHRDAENDGDHEQAESCPVQSRSLQRRSGFTLFRHSFALAFADSANILWTTELS